MPHLLQMTDGTSTVAMSTAPAMLRHYVPRSPKLNSRGEYEPVAEPVELMIYGASSAAVQASINVVERMLAAAAARERTGMGARIFVQYQPTGDATLWRSELLGGELLLADDAMTAFGQAKVNVRLTLRRRPWWEGARTQLPLGNGNGSNNTSGLTIYNHDDGGAGHDNWVDVAGGAVAGVLPAPVELRLKNTSGASRSYSDFVVANNRFDTALVHVLEGENRTGGLGTVTGDANRSNGQYLLLTGSSISCTWTLPTTVLQKTAGRSMRVVAALVGSLPSTPTYAKVAIRDFYGLVTLFESEETLISSNLADLGTAPLPPSGYRTDWAQLVLFLTFRSAASVGVALDFLQLTPAHERGCFRHFVQRGMVVLNNDWLVDDGIERQLYLIEGGANHPIYAERTEPLMVWPGVNQRLYFLVNGGSMTANWTMAVQAFYRPRRLTV